MGICYYIYQTNYDHVWIAMVLCFYNLYSVFANTICVEIHGESPKACKIELSTLVEEKILMFYHLSCVNMVDYLGVTTYMHSLMITKMVLFITSVHPLCEVAFAMCYS